MHTISNIVKTPAESVSEPVTLDEVKDWLQIDFNDHDSVLYSMIVGARESVEAAGNLVLVEKTISFDVCTTCAEIIDLPYAVGVTEVVVNSLNDSDEETLQTAGTHYFLRGGGLRLPSAGRYSVSYSSDPGDLPNAIKEAIKMEVAERYENRGENSDQLSKSANEKLAPYKIIYL